MSYQTVLENENHFGNNGRILVSLLGFQKRIFTQKTLLSFPNAKTTLIYVFDGGCSLRRVRGDEDSDGKTLSLDFQSCLFVLQNHEYELTPDTEKCSAVCISFEPFIAVHGETINAGSFPVSPFSANFTRRCDLNTIMLKAFENLISVIKSEFDLNAQSQRHILQSLLEMILMYFDDCHFERLRGILTNVHGVSFWIRGSSVKPAFLSFKKVSLYFKNPLENTDAIPVYETDICNPYIEIPKNTEFFVSSENGEHTGTFKGFSGNKIKLWFFAPKGSEKNLLKWQSDLYIVFSVKSDRQCFLNVSICNSPEYAHVSNSFEVFRSNQWQQQCFKVVGSFRSGERSSIADSTIGFIRQNYMRKISIAEIADYVHCSQSYLSTVFKKSTGQTIIGYLTFFRIEKTKEMLAVNSMKIEDIALSTGFYDQQHFSKVFKAQVGLSPKQYRKNLLHK